MHYLFSRFWWELNFSEKDIVLIKANDTETLNSLLRVLFVEICWCKCVNLLRSHRVKFNPMSRIRKIFWPKV